MQAKWQVHLFKCNPIYHNANEELRGSSPAKSLQENNFW